MKLNCVIIDDEPLAVNVIRNYVSQINGLELTATFNNAMESLEYLQKNEADLLFLDINMPVLDGLSFLEALDQRPEVIITTAHEEYAIRGYELEVLDYLLKPIPFPRFMQAVTKALKHKNKSEKVQAAGPETNHLFVKIDKKKLKKINLEDILVIESLKDYIRIITTSGKYIVHQTLSSFTDSLPKSRFLRIHRSFTISIDKVESVEGNSVEIDGKRYTIGRSYLNETKETILNNES